MDTIEVIQEFKAKILDCDDSGASDYLILPGDSSPQLFLPNNQGTLTAFQATDLPEIGPQGATVMRNENHLGVLSRFQDGSLWALYSMDGQLEYSGKLDDEVIKGCLCPDGTLVACTQRSLKAITASAEVRWQETRDPALYLHTKPVWHNGAVYFHEVSYPDFTTSALIRMDLDGQELNRYPLDINGQYSHQLLLCENRLYHAATLRRTNQTVLFSFADDLTCTETSIAAAEGAYPSDMLVGSDNSLWLDLLTNSILRIDRDSAEALARLDYEELVLLRIVDGAGNLVVQKNENDIEVYDAMLNPIQQHALSGRIRRSWLDENGKACLLVYAGFDQEQPLDDCTVTVYRIG